MSLSNFFLRIARRISDIERRLDGTVRHGTVHPGSLDTTAKTVRLRIGGTDAEPLLSPPVRYAQHAGRLKIHAPPSDGQQMTLVSPGGDVRQGVAVPFGWSDANPSPSNSGDENVLTYGSAKIELRDEEMIVTAPKVKFVCDGATFELSSAGLKALASSFDFNQG